MSKIKSVKKVDIPPNPLLEQGSEQKYYYHSQFSKHLCLLLAKPVRAELKRRNMNMKILSEELRKAGYVYSHEGLKQAVIGRNIAINNIHYWSVIYYYLDIPLDDVFPCKLDES